MAFLFKKTSFFCFFILIFSVLSTNFVIAATNWTAFNDCIYDSQQYIAENVSTFSIGNGYGGPTSGQLIDQATGQPTGVTVTFTQSGGVHWQPTAPYGGRDTDAGTDAYNTFHGIADMSGVIYYGESGWWVEVSFSGLDSRKRYTFVTSTNRAGGEGYSDRWVRYTIKDADQFTNESSEGVLVNSEDSVSFSAGENTATGYVAKWTNIAPGSDGDFTVRAECHGQPYNARRAYSFDVFMLQEEGETGEPEVDAGDDIWLKLPQDADFVSTKLNPTVEDDGKPWADPCDPATAFGLSLEWTVTGAPTGASVEFDPCSGVQSPMVRLDHTGIYTLKLTVSDGPEEFGGTTVSDVITITVQPDLTVSCPKGNLNSDCEINLQDLLLFVAQWLDQVNNSDDNGCADFNDDGRVNFEDYALLADNWLKSGTTVVINEIHYDPDVKTDLVEFIELHNPTTVDINLTGWSIQGGVYYEFPPESILPGEGYIIVAEDTDSVRQKFGIPTELVFGPFAGRLSNEGESVKLVSDKGDVIDHVKYKLGFPWPTVGDTINGNGRSIQLVNPFLDNDLGGSWRSALPTPTQANTGIFALNIPPQIRQVKHLPEQPRGGDTVTVTAKITDPDGVGQVILHYQIVEPGHYIRRSDPEYQTSWDDLTMHDDGLVGDETAGDDIYSVIIPSGIQKHRRLIRYRISATDQTGYSIQVPYEDDPQPNFAWFVYDGVPAWSGAIQPGSSDPAKRQVVTYSPEVLTHLPVYQFIANKQDVVDAMYWPGNKTGQYWGSDYPWEGTLVYDGKVYDHIHFRARGGVWRYSMGKNMWKFDFNRGHSFQARDDYGRKYKTKWTKLNFSACIQQGNYWHRGEQGMFEAVGFKLFNLVGVPAPKTNWVHFRLIDSEQENGPTQYDGDFQGLYLTIEQMDGRFLDEHGLPDGNLYKMEGGSGDLNNQGPTAATDKSDLYSFMSYPSTVQGWRNEFYLERYYSFRAIVEGIHHYDIGSGKNYFYYLNPQSNLWSILPWDLDLTWADNMFGNGNEPFKSRVLGSHPVFNKEYQNRLREIRSLLYKPEQMNRLIDEFAAKIDDPAGGPSMVDADRAMWDYNPILVSSYVNSSKAGHGRFYAGHPSGGIIIPSPGGFPGMVQLMKNYVISRKNWIDSSLLNDSSVPARPVISYQGQSDYALNDLVFHSSAFSDPQGADTFAAMEWRIAEVAWPGTVNYDPHKPNKYEITPTWQSGEINQFQADFTFPAGFLKVGRTYRVRCRMKDNTNRWSYWSSPIEFVTNEQIITPLLAGLRITELMYHPAVPPAGDNYTQDDYEFIELQNIASESIDISTVSFTKGVSFAFANGTKTSLAPGEIILLVANRTAFETLHPELADKIVGQYDGHLSNNGEILELTDMRQGPVLSFKYKDWYKLTDGQGFSLTIVDPASDPCDWNNSQSWTSSTLRGGSPGSTDTVIPDNAVVINEILAHSPAQEPDWIELYNTTANLDINLGGWYLSDDKDNLMKYRIPDDTWLNAGEYMVFYEDRHFGNPAVAAVPFALSENGETVYLSSAVNGELTGYRTQEDFGASQTGVSLGRYEKSTGTFNFVAMVSATPGAANSVPLVGPIVINEIMYNPPSGEQREEYVELLNISPAPVKLYDDLTNAPWKFTDGIDYTFPAGDAAVTVPAGGMLIIVPDKVYYISRYGALPTGAKLLGPYSGKLSNGGEKLQLSRPGDIDATGIRHYIRVDRVSYDDKGAWPVEADGGGSSLSRIESAAYGNDPANWRAAEPSPGRANP